MTLQTEVLRDYAPAIAGQVVGEIPFTRDRQAEVAVIAGLFCVQGTGDAECKLPTSSAEVAKGLGIAPSKVVHDSNFPIGGSSTATYQIGDSIDLVPVGVMWVRVEEAVDAGDTPYVRYDTGAGGSQKGAFRKSADTSTAASISGRYLTSAEEDGLAQVYINLP